MRTSYAAGPPAGHLARRLPRDPQGRPLPRVPARRVQRDDGLARRERRARRDLERHAVLLAVVGAPPDGRVAAPRARLDVGDDAPAAARARSAGTSSSTSRRSSTGARRSSRSRTRRRTSSCTSCTCRPQRITVVPPGHRPVVLARAATRSPTPLVVAVGRLVPVKRFHVLIDALATVQAAPARAAGGDRRRGLRARGARSARSRELGAERLDLAARPRRRRRRCSTSTGGRGCSRARRRTKAGA